MIPSEIPILSTAVWGGGAFFMCVPPILHTYGIVLESLNWLLSLDQSSGTTPKKEKLCKTNLRE